MPAAGRSRPAAQFAPAIVCATFMLGLSAAIPVFATESGTILDLSAKVEAAKKSDAKIIDPPRPDFSADTEARKSYLVPALEIVGFDVLLNRAAKPFDKKGEADVTWVTIRRNLRSSWVVDRYSFAVKYLWNRRDATFSDLGDRTQTRGTFGMFYTLLGHDRFGAVEWR